MVKGNSVIRGRGFRIGIALCVGWVATLLLTVFSARAAPADPPWNPNVQVNDAVTGFSDQSSPALAASKTTSDVVAIWVDDRNGDQDVYVARSTDGGATWGTATGVAQEGSGAWQSDPDIAVNAAGALHAVWTDYRGETSEVYYARSTDGGATWSTEVRINDVTSNTQSSPAVAVMTDTVCVAWADSRAGYTDIDIYMDCSTDGGVTWGADSRANNDASGSNQLSPDIAVDTGGTAHLVWTDRRNGNADVYYGHFSAAGGWVNVQLNADVGTATQSDPAIALDGQDIHVVWQDYRDGSNAIIFSAHSTDGGLTWPNFNQRVSGADNADTPALTMDGQGTAWATWRVYTDGQYFVYADSYGPNGWDTVNDVVTQSVTYKQAPAIAANQTWVQVVWEQSPVGADTDLLVSIWDDTDWRPAVKIDDMGDARQQFPAIARGSTGQLYAAWLDYRDDANRAALYTARSGDGGATWSSDVRADDDHPPSHSAPALVGAGPQVVHVVWGSTDQDYGAIYYDRSADSGVTWGTDRRLNTVDMSSASQPDIAISGTQQVFVVWVEGDALVLDRSADGGTTWLSPTQILTGTGYLDQPTLAAGPDGVLHLAWVEMIYIQATEYHIGYARSLDGGATWVDRQYVGEIVGIAAGERAHPDIAADLGSSYVYLVWDAADGIPQVLVAVSDDAGVSWGAPERLSSGDAEAVEPAVAVDAEGLVYVVWQDALNDSDDIFYRFSADYGATWSVTGRVNDDDTAYPQRHPALVGGNSAYAAWADFRAANWDIYATGLRLVCPAPVQGVILKGPTQTTVNVPVQLTAVISPSNASPPLTYVWTPQPATGQGTDTARYYWRKPGRYTVQVEVSNCGGKPVTAEHTVSVAAPPPPPLPCVEGVVSYGYTPLPNVTVELIVGASATAPPLQSTQTDLSGRYRFCNVAPGVYWLKRYGPTAEYIGWTASQITMGGSNLIKNLDLPKKMTLLTPANGATIYTTVPTLTWQANPEAGRYTMQINKTADWTLIEQRNNIVGTAYQVAAPLQTWMSYTWRIDAYTGTHWVGTTHDDFEFTTAQLITVVIPPLVEIHSSLRLEEASEGVVVNKLIGDSSGKTAYTYVDVVAYVWTYDAGAAANAHVILTVPDNKLNAPVSTWTRNTYGAALTAAASTYLGGGQYRVTTSLVKTCPWWFCSYHKQVVWRFRIPNSLTAQTLNLQSRVTHPGYWVLNSTSAANLRLVTTSEALIVTNRTQLYENHSAWEATSLLAQVYNVAQGSPYNDQPLGVVYNADLYDADIATWDNTAVNYTSETTANAVADEVDDLIEDWVEDGTWTWSYHYWFSTTVSIDLYPYYLLLVGDDDVLPFYRYNDPSNDEGINKISWCAHGWCTDSDTNPAIHATDEDYFFTDNPYADLWGGTDWRTGDLELAAGRLVGETAGDMRILLNSSLATDGGTWRAVMASVDGWELGYNNPSCPGSAIADVLNVPARLNARGFNVLNDIEASPSVDVLSASPNAATWINQFRAAANGGMDLFFIGGHNHYSYAGIYGDDFSPDDTCAGAGCDYNRFDNDHPLAFIVGCHGGLTVPDIDVPGGADDDMVYDLAQEGARAYIGATGFSYGSPGSLCHATWGERLLQHFFDVFLPSGTQSASIGGALRAAKDTYVFGFGGNDGLDRKTVTEFTLYGIPWQRLDYPGGLQQAVANQPAAVGGQPSAISIHAGNAVQSDTYRYTRTVTVDIASYDVSQVMTDSITYDILTIAGGGMALAPETPLLPYVKGYTLTLPISATVQSASLISATCMDVMPPGYEIPIIVAQPWTEGGTSYTTTTTLDDYYPANADRLQWQPQSHKMLFTLFPIQHNPTSNATRFCSQMVIEVVYDAPVVLDVSNVQPIAASFAPGAPISVTALLANVGDDLLTITSTLEVADAEGTPVGWADGGPFAIAPDGEESIEAGWDGLLDEGVYSLRLTLWSEGQLMGGATASVDVVGGALIALEVPTVTVALGDTATFRVHFSNYLAETVTVTAHLLVFDADGVPISPTLATQTMAVAGNGSAVFTFLWPANDVPMGDFTAQTSVERQAGPTYGPEQEVFRVGGNHFIYLRLVLRDA